MNTEQKESTSYQLEHIFQTRSYREKETDRILGPGGVMDKIKTSWSAFLELLTQGVKTDMCLLVIIDNQKQA